MSVFRTQNLYRARAKTLCFYPPFMCLPAKFDTNVSCPYSTRTSKRHYYTLHAFVVMSEMRHVIILGPKNHVHRQKLMTKQMQSIAPLTSSYD